MNQPRIATAFKIFWWTTGLVLLYYSVITFWDGMHATEHRSSLHAILIGGVEAVSAIFFLIPKTLIWGGVGLLFTIAVAFIIHALSGQFAANLLAYAAAVWFVMVCRETFLERSAPPPRAD